MYGLKILQFRRKKRLLTESNFPKQKMHIITCLCASASLFRKHGLVLAHTGTQHVKGE